MREPVGPPDWDRISRLWSSGVPTQVIATQTGLAASTIALKARSGKWVRDQDALLTAADVRKHAFRVGVSRVLALDPADAEDLIDEARTLNDHDLQAIIVQLHRRHVTKYRTLADTLFEELRAATEGREIYEQVAALASLTAGDPTASDQISRLYAKIVSLPQRISSLKQLVETAKIIVAIERESFGLKPIDYDDKAQRAAALAVEVVSEGFEVIQGKFQEVLREREPALAH